HTKQVEEAAKSEGNSDTAASYAEMAECPGGNCPKEDVAPPGTDDAEVVGKTTEP
ncbi:hypothetical protein Pmar_PMAR014375, partial [Perkinsus marinus ATCC 50983]